MSSKMESKYFNAKKSFGKFDKFGEWSITESDVPIIHKQFQLLYYNYLKNYNLIFQNFEENLDFNPQINDSSQQLAEKYREKLLQETALLIENQTLNVKIPENGKISHPDLLYLQKTAQQLKHQQEFQKQQTEKLQECTFSPKIIDMSQSLMQNQQISLIDISERKQENQSLIGMKKSEILYNMAKPSFQKKDKNADEVYYEKNCDQCTFQPDISKPKINLKRPKNYAKDITKSIERMRKGRAEQIYLEWQKNGRGYEPPSFDLFDINGGNINISQEKPSFSSKYSSQQYSKTKNLADIDENEDEAPLLFIDVNIGKNELKRIIVHQNDKSDILAENFISANNLSLEIKDKLIQLIEQQISSVLHKIDEEQPSIKSDDDIDNSQ